MIIFSFLTYHNLVLKRKRRQVIVIQQRWIKNDMNKQERKRDRQVFLILIVQTIIFVITVIPLMNYLFYNVITLNDKDKSVEQLAIERFSEFLVESIAYLFPVLSFYLYTMTSSIFRNELMSIIRSTLRCGCFFTIDPVTNGIEH